MNDIKQLLKQKKTPKCTYDQKVIILPSLGNKSPLI